MINNCAYLIEIILGCNSDEIAIGVFPEELPLLPKVESAVVGVDTPLEEEPRGHLATVLQLEPPDITRVHP